MPAQLTTESQHRPEVASNAKKRQARKTRVEQKVVQGKMLEKNDVLPLEQSYYYPVGEEQTRYDSK